MPIDFVYSVDEIVAVLKRSSLPTLVVEGKDDMIVYRRFEQLSDALTIDVFPAGGRRKVLDVYLRRHEFDPSSRVKFLADQDLWVITGIPKEYLSTELLFTDGYSLENDVVRDTARRLMFRDEPAAFEVDVMDFIEWYALALSRHLRDPSHGYKNHPDEILNPGNRTRLLALQEGETYPVELRNNIISEYGRLVRGKSLLAVALRQLKGDRTPKHNEKSLLEFYAILEGPSLLRLLTVVRSAFNGT